MEKVSEQIDTRGVMLFSAHILEFFPYSIDSGCQPTVPVHPCALVVLFK